MDPVSDIIGRMRISPAVDLDAYAEHEESTYVRPAAEYCETVWDHMHRPPHARGGLLPWSKTHKGIQVRTGELSIWAGKRGEGKSLITTQVLLALMMQGQKAVVASMEMPIEDTLQRMEQQGLGVDQPSRDYHEKFYEWAEGKLWMYDQGGVTPAKRILGLCRYSIQELGISQIVIDSLMMVGMPSKSSFEKLEQQATFVRELAAIARDTGAHIHLVAHLRKGDGSAKRPEADDVKGGGDITDLASVVYLISANRTKREESEKPPHEQKEKIMGQPDVSLQIEKNRRGPTGARYGLWLDETSLQLTERPGRKMEMLREVIG